MSTHTSKFQHHIKDATGLSQAQIRQLTSVFDLFHDYPVEWSPLPDNDMSHQYTMFHKFSATITKPTTEEWKDIDKWNVHFFTSPYLDATNELHPPDTVWRVYRHYHLLADNGQTIPSTSAVNSLLSEPYKRSVPPISDVPIKTGPIMWVIYPADDPDGMFSQMAVTGAVDFPYEETPQRTVGCAFEVTNVTAEMFKNGTVTVWRNNKVSTKSVRPLYRDTAYVKLSDGQEQFALNAIDTMIETVQGPPIDAQQANALYNAQTWNAIEGCYVTALPDIDNYNYDKVRPGATAYTFGGHREDPGVKGVYAICEMPYPESPIGAANTSTMSFSSPEKVAVMNHEVLFPRWELTVVTRRQALYHAGAIFTGLSSETVLDFKGRMVVQYTPAFDLGKIPLARPAPAYDPLLLTILKNVAVTLPPGCRKDDNDFGDWFRTIGGIIKGVANTAIGVVSAFGGSRQRGRGTVAVSGGSTVAVRGGNKTTTKSKDAIIQSLTDKLKAAKAKGGNQSKSNSKSSARNVTGRFNSR